MFTPLSTALDVCDIHISLPLYVKVLTRNCLSIHRNFAMSKFQPKRKPSKDNQITLHYIGFKTIFPKTQRTKNQNIHALISLVGVFYWSFITFPFIIWNSMTFLSVEWKSEIQNWKDRKIVARDRLQNFSHTALYVEFLYITFGIDFWHHLGVFPAISKINRMGYLLCVHKNGCCWSK